MNSGDGDGLPLSTLNRHEEQAIEGSPLADRSFCIAPIDLSEGVDCMTRLG
jgi:hypothetical protein